MPTAKNSSIIHDNRYVNMNDVRKKTLSCGRRRRKFHLERGIFSTLVMSKAEGLRRSFYNKPNDDDVNSTSLPSRRVWRKMKLDEYQGRRTKEEIGNHRNEQLIFDSRQKHLKRRKELAVRSHSPTDATRQLNWCFSCVWWKINVCFDEPMNSFSIISRHDANQFDRIWNLQERSRCSYYLFVLNDRTWCQ